MKQQKNKMTIFLTLGFTISLVACVFFAYLWIDSSITQAYSDKSYEINASLKNVTSLLEFEWRELTEEEVYSKLEKEVNRRAEDKIVLFKDNETDSIIFDTVEFKFKNGVLDNISGK